MTYPRYLVFSGSSYYADGGWLDFRGAFDTIDAARECAIKSVSGNDLDWWWHIADTSTGLIVDNLEGDHRASDTVHPHKTVEVT